MQKKLSLAVSLLLTPFILQQSVQSVQAATETVDINATIISAITLAETQPLSFGSIMPGTGAGTLTIDPSSGAESATGGIVTTGVSPAVIQVTAEPGLQLLASTDSSVTLYSGADTMVVDGFNIQTPTGGDNTVLTLSSNSEDVMIGATLQIGANQPPGNYTGTFTYTVDYQ